MTLGLESFIIWTLGQAHGSDWQDFQIQQIFMIKLEGTLKNYFFQNQVKNHQKNLFHHGTLDKLKEGASHFIECEICFCTQKLHPRARKIFDTWGHDFLAPNF